MHSAIYLTTIFCRHLSLKYTLDSLRNGKGKVNLIKHYSSVNPYSSISLYPGRGIESITSPSSCKESVIASQDFGFALDIFFSVE
ncbi:ShET2/EspL2 family type III secretion system effector toxin [Shigella sonnei]